MSSKVQQSVCSDCVTYVKSRIKFNTFNTFNNVKKQIILDEQDIKEFHEDAEHIRWLYNRMVCDHGESVNFDYMHRFAEIFNKLKQL